jgi:hypothetical protein
MSNAIPKHEQIAAEVQKVVLEHYLEHLGSRHHRLWLSDLAAQFKTNAATIRKALPDQDWDHFVGDRFSGDNWTGHYVESPCVEPSKSHLACIVNLYR